MTTISQDTIEMMDTIRETIDTVAMSASDFCEFARAVTFYRRGGMSTAQAAELAFEEVFTAEDMAKYRK